MLTQMDDTEQSLISVIQMHFIRILGLIGVAFVTLLWLQFPLRVLGFGIHRLINDIAQILFAYIWLFGFILASYHRTHLQVSHAKRGFFQSSFGQILTLPCAIFLIYSSWPIFVQSWIVAEKFSDTLSPGYYLIKLALILFSVAMAFMSIFQFKLQSHAE